MMRSALTGFLAFMLAAAPAFAACTSPTGSERDLIYNRDYHTYQFCNGTNWIVAGGGRGDVLGTPTAAGEHARLWGVCKFSKVKVASLGKASLCEGWFGG
ncbi:hypothetical protein [Methylocystis rosea]|uniref:hypothetical protein n=1 Tax=Methylocystis rosea TaxID=173366 RepID=UPI00037E99F0|nr:hypothetical protein [Methylocystis rosea]